jgi:hypothetical protein
MAALPLAPPEPCPRGPLGVAALADGKQPVTGSPDGLGEVSTGRTVRMSRSPGGRHRILGVRLTEEEEHQIRRRAEESGVSAQRFLVEAAMSGSAAEASERRRARRDVERAGFVLASVSNNLNQLAKWANSNHVLPDTFAGALEDIRRAATAVAVSTEQLHSAFEPDR